MPMRPSTFQNGKAQIAVVSKRGKEGVIAILEPGDEFFGEGVSRVSPCAWQPPAR